MNRPQRRARVGARTDGGARHRAQDDGDRGPAGGGTCPRSARRAALVAPGGGHGFKCDLPLDNKEFKASC